MSRHYLISFTLTVEDDADSNAVVDAIESLVDGEVRDQAEDGGSRCGVVFESSGHYSAREGTFVPNDLRERNALRDNNQ